MVFKFLFFPLDSSRLSALLTDNKNNKHNTLPSLAWSQVEAASKEFMAKREKKR